MRNDFKFTPRLVFSMQNAFAADFATLVELFKKNGLFDVGTKIILDEANHIIYFGHSIIELANFPEIMSFLLPPSKEFRKEENLSYSLKINIQVLNPVADQLKKLILDSQMLLKPINRQSSLLENSTEKDLLNLLSTHSGVLMGERHNEQYSKSILIKNMPLLKKMGLSVLFLEHLLSDTQTELLSLEKMPAILKQYLVSLDERFKTTSPYTFLNLVLTAQANGIRIIPLDNSASYSILGHAINNDSSRLRHQVMNYCTAQQIQKHATPEEKYITLSGDDHLSRYHESVPGLTELIPAPGIKVSDALLRITTHSNNSDSKEMSPTPPVEYNMSDSSSSSKTSMNRTRSNPAALFKSAEPEADFTNSDTSPQCSG